MSESPYLAENNILLEVQLNPYIYERVIILFEKANQQKTNPKPNPNEQKRYKKIKTKMKQKIYKMMFIGIRCLPTSALPTRHSDMFVETVLVFLRDMK